MDALINFLFVLLCSAIPLTILFFIYRTIKSNKKIDELSIPSNDRPTKIEIGLRILSGALSFAFTIFFFHLLIKTGEYRECLPALFLPVATGVYAWGGNKLFYKWSRGGVGVRSKRPKDD